MKKRISMNTISVGLMKNLESKQILTSKGIGREKAAPML
jgi:hypothetical protein